MRLAVLDTNVIVSAGIKPGTAPAQLIMDWVMDGRIQVVTSPAIVREYREVARRPKFRRYGFPPYWLDFLIDESLFLPDPETWSYREPDVTDMPFLALADISGAWLVTGNLRHFPQSIRKDVRVLSPSEYLTHLQQNAV